MSTPAALRLVLAIGSIVAIPQFLCAHSDGPPIGSVGPLLGDRSCSSALCHVNSGGGQGGVSLAFPKGRFYQPGAKQHAVLAIHDPVQKRWGFQTTARLANPRIAQAGDFESTDGNTQVRCDTDITKPEGQGCPGDPGAQYIEHTVRGTRNGTRGGITFEFDWNPPAAGSGDVIFYIGANAANGDGTNEGDHIYYKRVTVQEYVGGGKPAIATSGIVNGASFAEGVAPGSWITIQGANLAGTTRTWDEDDITDGKLPASLDSVGVAFNGKPGYVAYVSPTQVNVLAPSDLDTAASVAVQLTTLSGASAVVNAPLQPVRPGLFVWQGKYAVTQHADFSLAGPPGLFPDLETTPIKPGETIILYGTGFGQTSPPIPAGQVPSTPAPLPSAATVKIGGIQADVSYAGITPGAVGLYQINVRVPDQVPSGDQPVAVRYSGTTTQTGVVLNIAR